MAVHLLRNAARLSPLTSTNVQINLQSFHKRFIMATRPAAEKVLDELRRNPYFSKYAQKIAKFQETDPDEFLQRVEGQERKVQEKKVSVRLSAPGNVRTSQTLTSLLGNARFSWSHIERRYYSSQTSKNVYVTTPIFYVNADPHIGHLYSATLADAIARYKCMLGHSVHLCTGTDEHGTKVQRAATLANSSPPEYCKYISRKFQDMCDQFDVNYTDFIRTTEKRHHETVHHFWNTLEQKGHIYKGKYCGWYSVSDEAFIPDDQIIEITDKTGKNVKISVETGNSVEWTEEECYNFRLSAFEDDLKHWLKDETTVRPKVFHTMLSNWIEDGICSKDLTISRLAAKVPWAIPTPCDKSHNIYVWFDALVNYLTSVGYPNNSFNKFWPPTVQVIGKDILKFHGVYWPALLIGAGLEPPKTLLCHSHWTIDDKKMSKSKGNVVSPFTSASQFTNDGLRYFLLRGAVPHSDANYNEDKIMRILNSELASTFGNLINRCFSEKLNPDKEIPDPAEYVQFLKSDIANQNMSALESLSTKAQIDYENYNFHDVADVAMNTLHIANQMFTYHQPWTLTSSDTPEVKNELKAVLSLTLETVRMVALVLYPLIPRMASSLLHDLQVPTENRTWSDIVPLYQTCSSSKKRNITSQKITLFQRIQRR